jgi:hypothetical protein
VIRPSPDPASATGIPTVRDLADIVWLAEKASAEASPSAPHRQDQHEAVRPLCRRISDAVFAALPTSQTRTRHPPGSRR